MWKWRRLPLYLWECEIKDQNSCQEQTWHLKPFHPFRLFILTYFCQHVFFPEASFLKVFAWINVGLVYSYLKVVFQLRTFEFCKIKVFFPFNMRHVRKSWQNFIAMSWMTCIFVHASNVSKVGTYQCRIIHRACLVLRWANNPVCSTDPGGCDITLLLFP